MTIIGAKGIINPRLHSQRRPRHTYLCVNKEIVFLLVEAQASTSKLRIYLFKLQQNMSVIHTITTTFGCRENMRKIQENFRPFQILKNERRIGNHNSDWFYFPALSRQTNRNLRFKSTQNVIEREITEMKTSSTLRFSCAESDADGQAETKESIAEAI